jgi:hypothetical protein
VMDRDGFSKVGTGHSIIRKRVGSEISDRPFFAV